MEKIAGVFAFGMILAVASPIIGVLLGAFSGWCVGLVFEQEVMGFLARLGLNTAGLTMWQLGAALGFIGGFLKTTVHHRS